MDKKISAQEAAKAVLAKASEMLKSSQLMKASTHEKGIHMPGGKATDTHASHEGKSMPGAMIDAGNAVGGNFKEGAIGSAKNMHSDKLKELKAMPKPNLTKAQPEDRSKMSGKSGMVRGTTESNQNQKGVNQLGNNGSSGGMSEAGNNVRNAASGMKNGKANAVAIHKQTLGDLKSMPKPNLTKMEPTDDSSIAQAEKDQTPPDGVQKQPQPDTDPAQKKENGNPPWGTEPGSYKLSRFMGHLDAKRKGRGAQNGQG